MYNKITLVGNLTRDIEMRYTQSGTAIANTGIATNRKWKDQSGQQKEEVMFVDISFFGRSAEVANQYLRKGSKILVDGRLKLDQWTDNNNQKRSKHTVSVETMKMLDGNPNNNGGNNGGGYDNGSHNGNGNGSGQNNGNNGNGNGNGNGYNGNGGNGYGGNGGGGNGNGNQNNQNNQTNQPSEIPEIDIDEDEIPF